MLSIVVPLFRADEWISPFISAIGRHTATPYEIIFVHDGTITDVPAELMQKMPACMDVKQAVLLQQSGFPRAVNTGIHLAASEWEHLAILNVDIDLPGGWAKRLIAVLDEHREMGVVVPLTAGARTIPHPSEFVDIPAALDCREREQTMGADQEVQRASRAPHYVERPMVPFFCAMFERSRFERVGLLDDGFSNMRDTFGLGEDDDWCYRARRAGLTCAIATNVFVWHRWGTFFTGQMREQMTPKAMAHLATKWGMSPFRHPPVGVKVT